MSLNQGVYLGLTKAARIGISLLLQDVLSHCPSQ